MAEFITQNIGTFLVALLLAGLLVLITTKLIRDRKKGKGCGCGCDGCRMKDTCHSRK